MRSKEHRRSGLSDAAKQIWFATGPLTLPSPEEGPPSPSGGRAGDEGLRRQLNEGKLRDITY